MTRLWLILVGLALGTPAAARDMTDGWLITPTWERTCLRGAPLRQNESWVACGTGRLFDMPELALSYLGLGVACDAVSARADWQILGGEAWREQTCAVEAGWGRGMGIDVSWAMRRTETARREPWSRHEASLALRFTLGEVWRVAIHADPVSLTPGRAATHRSRWLLLSGCRDGLAWTLAVDRRRYEAPVARAALLARMASGVAFGVLAEAGTGTLGLTSAWVRGGIRLRSSHLVHPALGVTHRWMLVLDGGAP